MPNSLTEHERKRLISRLRLQRELQRRGADSHPKFFRQTLTVRTTDAIPFERVIQPWQERDFAALDVGWLAISGRSTLPPVPSPLEGERVFESFNRRPPHTSPLPHGGEGAILPIRRAYLERPRGHSKTTDTAVQVAWILQYARQPVIGLAAAADRDQAGLLHKAVADLIRLNPVLCPDLVPRQSSILNAATGSRLEVISSDVRSSWGQLPDFVICDELCHWEKPDLWHSLLSSAAKKPTCVLVVLTNAGVGTGWQWDVREAARTSPDWHFSSLAGPHAPWITPASLDEQRRLLPPAVFSRLWDNVWQQSDGEFVTLVEAEACRDPSLPPRSVNQPGVRYFAAVDYAEKHDRTVGVVVHREEDKIIVDAMDVVAPDALHPVPVRWVEEWIARMARTYRPIRFVLDEYQLVGTIQQLATSYDLKRFEFRGGKGNHALALQLRQLIIQQRLAWPSGCGQISGKSERDDLETELASLILHTSSNGRMRIDHRKDGDSHDDRAFALGAACLETLQEESIGDSFEVWDTGFGW